MTDKATRFAPKNIRQIGVTLPTDKIYIEDYVMTYIKQLSDVLNEERRVLALIGWMKEEDGTKYSCVSGVVELIKDEGLCDYKDLLIGSNLKKLNRVKEDYYGDLDFVGLCVISRDEWLRCDDGLYPFYREGMMGDLLLVRDGVNEEQVFRYSNTNFKKQRGYFIYYDRNESMQNYMLCMKDGKSIEYGYSPSEIIDRKVDDKIRSFSIPKNAVYSAKGASYKHIKINEDNGWKNKAKYVAISACVIAALGVGVVKVDKLVKTTKEKASKLAGETKAVMDNDATKLEVQTIAGNLVMKEDMEDYIDSVNKEDKAAGEENNKETEVKSSDASVDAQGDEANGDGNGSEGTIEGVGDENSGGSINENVDIGQGSTGNGVGGYTQGNVGNGSDADTQGSGQGEIYNGTKGNNKSGENTSANKNSSKEVSTKGSVGAHYYIVKKGDVLVDISRKIYGTHKKVAAIKKANGIVDEDKIFIGQRLLMP